MERGKFIVIEGVDGSGKTSTIKRAATLQDTSNIYYTTGFPHTSRIDKMLDTQPQSIPYYLRLLGQNQTKVKPNLQKGKHVVQDRYRQTVDTYEPDASLLINKLFVAIADPIFLKPDIYIQFLASVETIVDRLSAEDKKNNSYHQILIANPIRIKERQNRYQKLLDEMSGPKYTIDTTSKTVDESAAQLVDIFERYNIC